MCKALQLRDLSYQFKYGAKAIKHSFFFSLANEVFWFIPKQLPFELNDFQFQLFIVKCVNIICMGLCVCVWVVCVLCFYRKYLLDWFLNLKAKSHNVCVPKRFFVLIFFFVSTAAWKSQCKNRLWLKTQIK